MFSGAILAGGHSRRMGRDKAELTLGGRTLLEWQVEKLRGLGIDDIMVSGHNAAGPGARPIADVYPNRGPLGGLHACLSAARCPHCAVLSVDVPMVPVSTLEEMAKAHLNGDCEATLLTHAGREEPLIGIYSRSILTQVEVVLQGTDHSMRALLRSIRWQGCDYDGPEELLINCNTPEDYALLRQIAQNNCPIGANVL